jgi:DNA mismatch repair protein MutS
MRTLKKGGSNLSFGIHVAKMAGMPKDIVDNANILLKELESVRGGNKKIDLNDKKLQLSFFDIEDPIMKDIRNMLLDIDIDSLTPLEALMKLNEIKKLIGNK